MPKLSINIEEILSRADGKPVQENKFLESSVININYCIITTIINTRFKDIIFFIGAAAQRGPWPPHS